ncbi:hypothetical protein RFI_30610, partial [Reticulomyxa filosa]
ELLQVTDNKHPDYNPIQSSLKQIESVIETMDVRTKDFSSREQVREVEKRLGNSLSLVAPARHYIREGHLFKVCRKKERKYLFILFSDLLLYCTQSSTGKLVLNNMLPLDRYFRIEDIQTNRKYGSLCFEIHSTVKSFVVYTDNLADKKAWLQDVRSCVEQIHTQSQNLYFTI